MSVSVGLRCDRCGVFADCFTNPADFTAYGQLLVTVAIWDGEKSPDFCRRCFSELLGCLAAITRPKD